MRGILAMEESVIEQMPVGSELDLSHVEDLNQLAEANDTMLEYSIMSELADDRMDSVNALTGIQDAMSDSLENGGLTEIEAQTIAVAVEHFCKKAYIRKVPNIAVEHFSSTAGRKQATKVALEGIGSAIKTMIDNIIRWVKNAVQYVIDAITSLFTGADNLVKQTNRIQAKAKAISNKTIAPKNEKFKEKKLAAFFTKDAVTFSPDKIISEYSTYCRFVNDTFKDSFIKVMSVQMYGFADSAKKGAKEETVQNAVTLRLNNLKSEIFKQFEKDAANTDGDKEGLRHSLPFGQKFISVIFTKKGEDYTGFDLKVDNDPPIPDNIAEHDIETLKHKQILDIANAVENQLKNGLYKHIKLTQDKLNKINSEVEKICKDISRDQESEERAVAFSVNFVKEIVNSVVAMIGGIHQYEISVARALLSYCARSIEKHEK